MILSTIWQNKPMIAGALSVSPGRSRDRDGRFSALVNSEKTTRTLRGRCLWAGAREEGGE